MRHSKNPTRQPALTLPTRDAGEMRAVLDSLLRLFDAWTCESWPAIECGVLRLRASLRDEYENCGEPYGASFDGLVRWLREVREIEALRRRADALERQHQKGRLPR